MFEFLKKLQKLNKDKTKEKYIKFVEADSVGRRAIAKGSLMGELQAKHKNLVYAVDYVGGFPEQPTGRENIKVYSVPAGLLLSHGTEGTDIIPWEDIESVELKTQEQIHRDVTLTRLVAFGWYALALKKRRKSTVYYTVLKCKRCEMTYKVVFGGNNALYSYLFTILSNGTHKDVLQCIQGA